MAHAILVEVENMFDRKIIRFNIRHAIFRTSFNQYVPVHILAKSCFILANLSIVKSHTSAKASHVLTLRLKLS